MKKDKLKLFIVVCLLLAIMAFGYASYAYFVTRVSGNVGAMIAGWNFSFTKMTNVDGEMVPQSLEGSTYYIDLAETCTNCTGGKINPGSSGEFTVYVDAGSSNTETESTIRMFNLGIDGMDTLPSGLQFCSDENCSSVYSKDELSTSDGVLIGEFLWASDEEKKANTTVYWKWDFDAGYDNDYQGKEIKFSMVASASQVVHEVEPIQ